MRYAPQGGSRIFFALALSFVLGACAYAIPEVDPADIPDIQTAIAADPENTDLQVQLGMAQFKAEDFDASRATLQAAVDAGNESGPALLYLGMVNEEFEDWSAARDAYTRYIDVGRSEELKENLRGRLQLIAQNVLRQEAQAALAQEAEITNADAVPQSIAVMPFAFNSDDPNLEPLIYALADMMVTDFKVSNALTVLERAQIQSLLDEIGLTEAGYAEAASGARAGRLLQAEHVVQGVLTPIGEDLTVNQSVLNIPNASTAGTIDESATLEALFDMEKQLVIRTIREVLQVTLTPAEEQQILDNRTDNVLALVAYGRGLRLKDQGNYAAAQQQFQQAADLDPGFEAAQTESTETAVMDDAATTTTTDIASTAASTGETTQSGTVTPPTTSTTGGTTTSDGTTTTQTSQTLSGASNAVNPNPTSNTIDLGSTQSSDTQTQQQSSEDRSDAVQESQGSENVTTAAQAQIRIVIRRPGGGQ